jgi:OOP family OmpA-OmpF porin
MSLLYDFNGVSSIVVPYLGVSVGSQWASEQFDSVPIAASTITTNRSQTPGRFRILGLPVRRAAAVKAELINDGVPAAKIDTSGLGETHLLVPTGAGMREPQNRSVEIIIH